MCSGFFVKHILIADDDEDDCILFEDTLRELSDDTQLTVATNGEHLIQVLKNNSGQLPEIVFLDLNMPLKNGFECLKEIREDPRLKNLPVVIFSTSAQPQAVDAVYEQGANLFVQKPNTFQQLKDVIRYVLSVNWKNCPVRLPREQFLIAC